MKKAISVILSVCLIVVFLPTGSVFATEPRPSYLFAIDAGHGGNDPGCIGDKGRYESNDNIKIANEVISLLKKQGQKTHLINRDQKTELRPVEANNIGADFLISLHRDSSSSSSASGINIYTHEPSHKQRTEQPQKDYAPNERADKHSVDERLVNNLYNYLTGATGLSVAKPHYGSASAPTWEDYYINRISNMPSCIIEFGFATNPSDNAIFDANYKTLAKCVVKALMATVGLDYVEPNKNTGSSIYTQNGKSYYVVNGEVCWEISDEIEYNNNVYTVTKGIAELSAITVNDGVSVIETNAYKDYKTLKKVTLPNSLTEIKDGAFSGCTELKTVIFCGSEEQFNSLIVGENNTAFTSAEVLYICDLEGHTYLFECSPKCEVCGKERQVTHTYSFVCDETCNICGEKRITEHTYSSDCDTNCDICQHRRETTTAHDFDENDICRNCGSNKYILGDINSDEKVTDADAVYLLMYTFFPDDYPVFQPCDFNSDGKVTDADAVYLLMYTFFPEDYPL